MSDVFEGDFALSGGRYCAVGAQLKDIAWCRSE